MSREGNAVWVRGKGIVGLAHNCGTRLLWNGITVPGPAVIPEKLDSDAVLSIYTARGFPRRLLAVLPIIPAFLRDPVYRWFAPPEYRARIL